MIPGRNRTPGTVSSKLPEFSFPRKDFRGGGINGIIAEARPAKASFYQYAPSKESLCEVWLRRVHQHSGVERKELLQETGPVRDRDALMRFALQRVSDYGATEDLVQDTFLSAWHGRQTFRGDCSERTWLTGILRNKIIDFYRRRARRPLVLSIDLTPRAEDGEVSASWTERRADAGGRNLTAAEVDRTEFLGDLERALNQLPEKMGKAFRMRENQGQSTEQIIEDLKISKANLWVLIHRARQALGQSLAEPWGETEEFGTIRVA